MPPLTQANQVIRSATVTASEVAALMPCGHPYTTPEAIYDRLVTPSIVPDNGSQAMRIGSAMEAAILRFAETEVGFRAKANARTFVHPRVRLAATPDAFLVGRWPMAFTEERALVEIKMSGRAEMWRDGVPPHIDWQCRAQMAVMDRDTVYIVVLAAMRLLTLPVYRDAGMEDQLLECVDAFWRDHIAARVRPEPAVPASPGPISFDAAEAILR